MSILLYPKLRVYNVLTYLKKEKKMACIVFVEITVKEQAVDQVNDLMASQDGLPTTRSQKGCLSVEVLADYPLW